MDTMALGSNGIGNTASAQRGAGNLTYEQRVVKGHEGLDSLPGYVLVVFEKRAKGGAIFSRLVRPGEVFPAGFRIPFLDWSSQKYFSVAVNNSVLKYSFEQLVTLDDGSDEFKLKFDLKYMVADPQKVAEGWEHDPLWKLQDEIARVITRNCARRKAEMFRSRFRELERIVVDSESGGLRAYAANLGFKIISIDLGKTFSEHKRGVIKTREKAEADKATYEIEERLRRAKERDARVWEHEKSEGDLDFEYDQRRRRLDRQIDLQERETTVRRAEQTWKLMDYQTEAVGQAMKHVGDGTHTAAEFREGYEVAREITMGMQADRETRELPPGFERKQIGDPAESANGENQLGSLLDRAIRQIEKWNCPRATKQELRSAIFHLVSEAMLDDHADEKVLKQYANKLSELGRQAQLSRGQRLFLEGFQNIDELKDKLR
ncbi:MAG: hypothetical protein WAQ99_12570 [Pyrinomonadaceae bacterium]